MQSDIVLSLLCHWLHCVKVSDIFLLSILLFLMLLSFQVSFVNLVFSVLGSSLLSRFTSQKMTLFCGLSKVTYAHSAYFVINKTGTVFFKVLIMQGWDRCAFQRCHTH